MLWSYQNEIHEIPSRTYNPFLHSDQEWVLLSNDTSLRVLILLLGQDHLGVGSFLGLVS